MTCVVSTHWVRNAIMYNALLCITISYLRLEQTVSCQISLAQCSQLQERFNVVNLDNPPVQLEVQ